MKLTTWIRPDKSEIDLNDTDATVEKAKSLGWKKKVTRAKKVEKVTK